MSTENKASVHRYGISIPDNALFMKSGTTAERESNPTTDLLRLNSQLNAVDYFLNDRWFTLKPGAFDLANVAAGNFTTVTGKLYPVNSTVSVITLHSSPVVGDTVTFLDYSGSFGSTNVTINRNGNKINGLTENYTLNRIYDSVTLTFRGPEYGWSVSHSKPIVTSVVERFSGEVAITQTTPVDIPVNKVVTIDLEEHQTVNLTAKEANYGDEIHLLCINSTGAGAVPAASINVQAGRTLNGVLNASITLNGKGSWLKLKYLNGWKVIGQSNLRSLVAGKTLNRILLKVPVSTTSIP